MKTIVICYYYACLEFYPTRNSNVGKASRYEIKALLLLLDY